MDHAHNIDRALAARTRAERADAALALAGLTWAQFGRMTGRKRAHLYGARWRHTADLIADYTGADREWLETGRLPPGEDPPRRVVMSDEDYRRLCGLYRLFRLRGV